MSGTFGACDRKLDVNDIEHAVNHRSVTEKEFCNRSGLSGKEPVSENHVDRIRQYNIPLLAGGQGQSCWILQLMQQFRVTLQCNRVPREIVHAIRCGRVPREGVRGIGMGNIMRKMVARSRCNFPFGQTWPLRCTKTRVGCGTVVHILQVFELDAIVIAVGGRRGHSADNLDLSLRK